MNEADRWQLINELETRFEPFTTELYKRLRSHKFYFEEQSQTHLLHLNLSLVIRHSLPYCLTEETYFSLDEHDVDFFAAVILLHSLALTHIDDYYDGGYQTKGTSPLSVDALAYSLSATHEAMQTLIRQSPKAAQLVDMLAVTNFVHARMYKDYTERYHSEYLVPSNERLQEYIHSPRSRLLGSGYWEVMARASFVRRGRTFPAYLHSIDIKLRKFRQIIDELADIEEDLRGGLVTLPILYALTTHQRPEVVRRATLDYWEGVSDSDILPHLKECGTYTWIYAQAMALYDSAMRDLDRHLGSRGNGYRQLFFYKKAKLDLLMDAL